MDSLLFFWNFYNILTINHVLFDRGKICSTILIEEFKKRFRLTKSTITKLLEQVGIYQRTAQRLKGSSFYQYLYILHYYELHQRAGVCLFTTSAINDVTNNAIGLGQGQWWIQALADLAGIGCDIFREIGLLP